MRRVGTIACLLLCAHLAYGQSWTDTKAVRSTSGGTSGNVVVWDTILRYVIDTGVSLSSITNVTSWVSLYSNAVQYMCTRTQTWDAVSDYIAAHSNAIDYVQVQTGGWDKAWNWVNANSGGVYYVFGRTQTWDLVEAYVTAHSNAVNYWESRSNAIDLAETWTATHSNWVQYMESRTSVWDSIAANGATNAGAGLTDIFVMSNGEWIAVDPAVALITDVDVLNWNDAVSWGDHHLMGYATNTAAGSTTTNAMVAGQWVPITVGSGGAGDGSCTAAVSYISGLWPAYLDTNSVTLTNGEGYCNGQYFSQTNAVNVDITAAELAGGIAWEWHYIYLDYSASTFPSTLTYYTSTNEPTKSPTKHGWYNGDDRVIGAVMASNTAAILLPYTIHDDQIINWRYYNVYAQTGILLTGLMNPTGAWQTPDASESSAYLPVNALDGLFRMHGSCAGSYSLCSIATYEDSLVRTSAVLYGRGSVQSYVRVDATYLVSLGPSRNVRIADTDAAANELVLQILGYRTGR